MHFSIFLSVFLLLPNIHFNFFKNYIISDVHLSAKITDTFKLVFRTLSVQSFENLAVTTQRVPTIDLDVKLHVILPLSKFLLFRSYYKNIILLYFQILQVRNSENPMISVLRIFNISKIQL